jgi:hypothetical protein
MQENGATALRYIGDSVRMAGFLATMEPQQHQYDSRRDRDARRSR